MAIRKHGSLSAIDQIKNERADKKFAQQAAQRKRDAAAGGLDERQQAQVRAGGCAKGTGGPRLLKQVAAFLLCDYALGCSQTIEAHIVR